MIVIDIAMMGLDTVIVDSDQGRDHR